MARRPEIHKAVGYEMHIIGGAAPGLRDLYHGLLRIPWWGALGVIAGGYLGLNALFAVAFTFSGGVQGAEPGSFIDAFFFSVQTMGTIGYGAMAPVTRAAHALVVLESVVGLVATALATGIVFVRFSQTRARVVFTTRLAIAPVDGTPTLMIRVGNERRGSIIEAQFRLSLMLTSKTAEGVVFYRSVDLPLLRARAPALSRAWTVQHRIDANSPLYGETPASLAAAEAEIDLMVMGLDDTSLQPAHARRVWPARSIAWGARLADVMSETEGGNLTIDLRRFDELIPSDATEAFPYRWSEGAERLE